MYARRPTRPKPRMSMPKKWPAPVAGWVANRALATPQSIDGPGAAVLENFFPKATSVALRRGSRTVANLPEPSVTTDALFSYHNGTNEQFFAATASKIYNITGIPNTVAPLPSDAIAGTVVASGYTSGAWIVTQFATTGGVYMVGVNGADVGFLYDGTTFTPLSGGTAPTVTFPLGLTSADMAYVWVYKNRLFFARKGKMDAFYLAIDSVGGTASIFPLSGVFSEGGELLFGSSWSRDNTGNTGLYEQCVFVSSEGQVAVYQGADPANASDWFKVGLYRIGAPLGRRAFIRGGGDLAIATTVGMVPLSKAVSLDVTALATASVSYKIADAWSQAVQQGAKDWQCLIWPEAKMAIVAPKSDNALPVLFISNTETGAWCKYTGWDTRSFHTFGGRLFFGSTAARVILANVAGDDNGIPYTGALLPLFEDFEAPMSTKIATVGRARVMANISLQDRITFAADFNITPPAAPDGARPGIVSEWGFGIWNASVWSDVRPTIMSQNWHSIGGDGYSVSLWYQVTSAAQGPLDAEVIGLEMLYTTTEVLG
jgi:hypothetical protein